MYSHLLVTALLAIDTLATPVRTIAPKRRAADGFSIQVTRKNHSEITSGPAVVSKTYRKFHGAVPQADESGFGALKTKLDSSEGTVAADPTAYDQEYLSDVYVGAQKLSLDFDTGSSDLWVYSSELSAAAQAGHGVYNPNRSSVARHLANQTWEVQYGDGSSASGDVWTDCVWIGGTLVEHQAVELAQKLSAEFRADVNSDGILGLGFDALNSVVPTQQSTFVSNAIAQGLPQPVFTTDLRYHASGSYDFGFIDQSKYSGDLAYVPVDSSAGYWRFNTTGFGWTSNGTTNAYSLTVDSVVDTGTSIIFAETNIALYYWAQVPSAHYDSMAGGYVFACDQAASLPELIFTIGNYNATIPGQYLAYAPADSAGATCYGGLQPNTGLPFQVLGDVFLKATFVVFDAGVPRLGFADKA